MLEVGASRAKTPILGSLSWADTDLIDPVPGKSILCHPVPASCAPRFVGREFEEWEEFFLC